MNNCLVVVVFAGNDGLDDMFLDSDSEFIQLNFFGMLQ